MIFWIWAAVIITALVLYLRNAYSRFSRCGVKHLTPIPPFGNLARFLLRMDNLTDHFDSLCNSFPSERFIGRYDFTSPTVVVKDIDLIKKLTVKDFEYFLDHSPIVSKETDPIFGGILFSLQGDEWKDMRSTLSPAFTSSKIRLMVPMMVEVGDQMIRSLRDKIRFSGVEYIDIDAKDLMTRYANDVIASCAFGLKINSHAEEQNEFYMNGKEAANLGGIVPMLKFFAFALFPKLMLRLNMTVFPRDIQQFFRSVVLNNMQNREAHNIIRPDMIHLLMQAKKGKLSHEPKTTADADADAGFATVEESAVGKKEVNRVWSDDDLVAQAVLFFLAGFETVSSAMSFLIHELAINPDVQERLVQEIKENDAQNGGKFDYNSIQKLTYLDMVISEVLRLWPPAIQLDRICKKDYNMGKPNDSAPEDYIIHKGDTVIIPAWTIHRDSKYFPNPNKFDPERFSEQNKHSIKPFTYMPFGLGPRNCIGSRFALCEVKVMAYQLLRSVELSPAARTRIPAKLSKDSFGLKIEGGHWVRMKIRS